jgi:hypothetical protein
LSKKRKKKNGGKTQIACFGEEITGTDVINPKDCPGFESL